MSWQRRQKSTKQIDTFVLDGAKKDDVERMARYVIRAQKYAGQPNSNEVREARQKGVSWHMAVERQFVEVVRRTRTTTAHQQATDRGGEKDHNGAEEKAMVEHSKHYIYRTPSAAHYNTLLQSVEKERNRLLKAG
jgi:hypothetical protein